MASFRSVVLWRLSFAAALGCTLYIVPDLARAQDRPTGLVIGGKLGGGIGAPLSESDASFTAEFELGYVLPPLDHAFELFTSFGYSAPHVEGVVAEPDPRLPGDGVLHYEVDQQTAALSLGLRYRLDLQSVLTPYASAGGRLYLLSTDVRGEAGGEAFGDNRETTSALGAFFALGVEIGVGPGALLAEVQLDYGNLDSYVLRDTNAGLLSLMVGYRFMFPMSSRAMDSSTDEAMPAAIEEPRPTVQAGAPDDVGTTTPSEGGVASGDEPLAIEDAAGAAPAAAESVATAPPTAAESSAPQAAKAQVRGHVRGFSGQPLRATIRIQPSGVKATTNADGYFEVEIPPGRYDVRLRSFGYVSQTRSIVVEENGVTVLNVELAKK